MTEGIEKHYYSQPEVRARSAARARGAAELGYVAYVHEHMSEQPCVAACRKVIAR